MKGFFIAFEGMDGVGKTTQVQLLAESLQKKGWAVTVTREPGGTPAGERIRGLLLDPALAGLTPLAEVLLYAAARAEHVARKIIPDLEAGRVVISDRFVDSTLAYQGYGRGLDLPALSGINRLAAGSLVPHLTVLLDMPVEEALARLPAGADRLERESGAFFRRVRRGFLELRLRDPQRYLLLDGRLPPLELHGRILRVVEERLK
ncbi:MAG: dTMP kinase [Thermoanaerobacteraceae bacterium]|nr:dTMP kinase [Thermoanaerobacteraceae bacterium]